jgi:hypothetical protein
MGVVVRMLWCAGLLSVALVAAPGDAVGKVPVAAPQPTPTPVIAGLGEQGAGGVVFHSQAAPYSIVPPAGWPPKMETDPQSGLWFDTFVASSARLVVIVAFPAEAVHPSDIEANWGQHGYHVTALGRVRIAGKGEEVYGYRDLPGDPPPVQRYATVLLATRARTWLLSLGSDPGHFASDLPLFLASVRTFQLGAGG